MAAKEKEEKAEGEDQDDGLQDRNNLENDVVNEGNRQVKPLPPQGRPKKLESQ